ncbi:MAG TPA: RNA polymerase sigma-54 factor, partial [Xanthomonadaceae bacterium]|nr:RNA polymerase sigma-54 factor [Xanthomonadaceae bacterium]
HTLSLHDALPILAACDLRECLQVQLAALPGRVPARHLAGRILEGSQELLASHDYEALARQLGAETADVREAVRLLLSLQPRPGEDLLPDSDPSVIPDVLAWHADSQWRVALNPATTHRVSINPIHERALAEAGEAAAPLREMLQEARWL